ncbi:MULTISPECIES: phosphotransferase [Bacillaceae]|uniref:Phosphotransferase n=1 Tax=Evansella alkalicola TaxID=745819 RepID=A0ABS6JQY2_9BACI|nr:MULTISPECIES: phosphotransferase [Bacillaceae]MBU9720968.1 phosphotransferase [Bacillus alkalicola]
MNRNRDNEIQELLHYFFDDKQFGQIYEGKSGYNNTTCYLKREEKKYIVRIYETHRDEGKVKLEHDFLLKLQDVPDMPFKVPLPVVRDGETLYRLSSGKIGCVYHHIEGENPDFETSEELVSFGASTGNLMHALSKIEVDQPFIYQPYYEIEHAHPNCPLTEVVSWCNNPPEAFAEWKKELHWIAEQVMSFHKYVPHLKALLHQIIHGDLNASNVLVGHDKRITAILDFEFTTWDLRVMEVAVCVSDILFNGDKREFNLEKVQHFFKGLSSTIKLTDAELKSLPILVQLRRLDVFLHFLGRYLDGIDDAAVLKEQIEKAAGTEEVLHQLTDFLQ